MKKKKKKNEQRGIFIYCYRVCALSPPDVDKREASRHFQLLPRIPFALLRHASANLIELRYAYASFRIARGKLSRKLLMARYTDEVYTGERSWRPVTLTPFQREYAIIRRNQRVKSRIRCFAFSTYARTIEMSIRFAER